LPAGEQYRIVFMHRDLNEAITSQRAMLTRLARDGARLDDSVLAHTYANQLARVQTWLQRGPEIQALPVGYADAKSAIPPEPPRDWLVFSGSPSTNPRQRRRRTLPCGGRGRRQVCPFDPRGTGARPSPSSACHGRQNT